MSTAETDSSQALRGLDAESRQMVVETVRQLRKKLLTQEKVLAWDKEEHFPEAVIREMLGPEIGLQLIFIPEEFGGMGGGARDCCAVVEEVCRICLGIGTAFFVIHLGADPILVGATDEQKAKWLGAIADGTSLVAYAVTEPEAGSNLASLKTKAEPVEGDNGEISGYKITGTKQFISNGGYADFITCLANTPDGPSFFVVEKGTPGFEQKKGEEKHGIRASNTSPLTLDNVFVPIENLVGGVPGKGLKQANEVFGYTRLMVGSMAMGAGRAALDIAIPYAKERIQFGTTLSEKQGYTHKLILPNAVKLEAAAAYIDEVALQLDTAEEDLQVEGAIAKYFAAETANKTADDAVQALGGYGYICEFEVEKIRRDVKITCIYEGTSEILQNVIATFRWKKTRKTKGEFYAGIAREMLAAHETQNDAGCRFIGLAAEALNAAINLAHEKRLTRQQHVMFALADMMTYVEVGAALARKALKMAAAGESGAEKFRLMSKVFANQVTELVSGNLSRILMGSGLMTSEEAGAFLNQVSHEKMMQSYRDVITDMDKLADIVFER